MRDHKIEEAYKNNKNSKAFSYVTALILYSTFCPGIFYFILVLIIFV